jgi:heat shock transcription factor, other eukaryote
MASRKRRAPGASPQVQQQPGIQAYPQDIGNMSSEPYLNNWGDTSMMGDLNAGDAFNSYGNTYGLGGAAGPSHNRIVSLDGQDDPMTGADLTSGQLVRRNPNQQLAARGRSAWDAFDSNGQ